MLFATMADELNYTRINIKISKSAKYIHLDAPLASLNKIYVKKFGKI